MRPFLFLQRNATLTLGWDVNGFFNMRVHSCVQDMSQEPLGDTVRVLCIFPILGLQITICDSMEGDSVLLLLWAGESSAINSFRMYFLIPTIQLLRGPRIFQLAKGIPMNEEKVPFSQ